MWSLLGVYYEGFAVWRSRRGGAWSHSYSAKTALDAVGRIYSRKAKRKLGDE